MKHFYSLIIFFLSFSSTAYGQFDEGNKYVKATLVTDQAIIQPAENSEDAIVKIGVLFEITPGWHIYWLNSGEAALPTTVNWKLPKDFSAGSLQWPAPTKFIERGDIITYGYKNQTLLFAELYGPNIIPEEGETVLLQATARWLVCNDICIPGSIELKSELPFSTDKPQLPSEYLDKFHYYEPLTPKEFPNIAITGGINNSDALLIVEGLNTTNIHKLAEGLQVFPNSLTGLNSRQSLLTKSVNSNSIALLLPKNDESTLPNKASGILVIKKDLINEANNEIVVPWEVSFTENLGLSSSPATTLTHRLSSFKDHVEPISLTNKSTNTGELLVAIFFGFIAGLILNLMPCVLPIISIKVLGFLGHAEKTKAEALKSASFFAAGIITTFVALAAIIISLREVGIQLGWGFQFQFPEFVFALTIVVFVLALGFFDIYHFTVPFLQKANKSVSELQGPSRQFFDGILATLLSTPCAAPFLGTALAFAFTAPPLAIFLVFIAIGAGLALPYVFLSTHQGLLKLLPKPGDWMYRLRELMGFLLLGTVIWLLYVLSKLTDDGAIWTLFLLLGLYVWFWLKNVKLVIKISGFVLLLMSAVYLWPDITTLKGTKTVAEEGEINWVPYSHELLEKVQIENQAVFLDFTAEWCITCKANEKLVIETEEVMTALKLYDITPIKADWTARDKTISNALKRFKGNGVPHYVVMKGDKTIVLPTILTPTALTNSFKEITNK